MTCIVLLGCGGIGRRHLEALGRLAGQPDIFVVEPDAARRQAAAETAAAAFSTSERVRCLEDCATLPKTAEVAIVATTAPPRRRAVEALLEHCRPSFLVLEKVLFQRPEDYAAVERLLAEAGVRAWVNCPRRLWPQYRALAEEIAPCPRLLLQVVAPPAIGPGSNAIHMLDLFAFLTGAATVAVDASRLHLLPGAGKRGSVEFVGTLSGHTAAGGTLLYTTLAEGAHPLRLDLDAFDRQGRGLSLSFEEGRGRLRRATAEGGWRWTETAAPPVYQSRLTDLLVEDLLERGDCGLATFDESSRLHLDLLSALGERLEALGVDTRDGVAIT